MYLIQQVILLYQKQEIILVIQQAGLIQFHILLSLAAEVVQKIQVEAVVPEVLEKAEILLRHIQLHH